MNFLHTFVPIDTRLFNDPLIIKMIDTEKRNKSFEMLIRIFTYLLEFPDRVGNYKLNRALFNRSGTYNNLIIRIIEDYNLFAYNPQTGEFYSRYIRQAQKMPADIKDTTGFILPKHDLLEQYHRKNSEYPNRRSEYTQCADCVHSEYTDSPQVPDNQVGSFKKLDKRENTDRKTTSSTYKKAADEVADFSHCVDMIFNDRKYLSRLQRRYDIKDSQLEDLKTWFTDRCILQSKDAPNLQNCKNYLCCLVRDNRHTREEFDAYSTKQEALRIFQAQQAELQQGNKSPKQETVEERLLRQFGYVSEIETIRNGRRYATNGDPLPDDAQPQWNSNSRWSYIQHDWIYRENWFKSKEHAEGKRQGFHFPDDNKDK